jgi:thiol-disulfide isomerase/thioredoxin
VINPQTTRNQHAEESAMRFRPNVLLTTLAAAAALAAGVSWVASGAPDFPEAADAATTTLKVGSAAPELAGIDHWLNSPPLTLGQLRGKVVLVDFWTASCINCIHTLPSVNDWNRKYASEGLVVIGVHTPEYPFERSTHTVQEAIDRFGIRYPVAQDNSYATWHAFGNEYWPASYLVDRSGHVVYTHFGEGDYAETEAAIKNALAKAS